MDEIRFTNKNKQEFILDKTSIKNAAIKSNFMGGRRILLESTDGTLKSYKSSALRKIIQKSGATHFEKDKMTYILNAKVYGNDSKDALKNRNIFTKAMFSLRHLGSKDSRVTLPQGEVELNNIIKEGLPSLLLHLKPNDKNSEAIRTEIANRINNKFKSANLVNPENIIFSSDQIWIHFNEYSHELFKNVDFMTYVRSAGVGLNLKGSNGCDVAINKNNWDQFRDFILT